MFRSISRTGVTVAPNFPCKVTPTHDTFVPKRSLCRTPRPSPSSSASPYDNGQLENFPRVQRAKYSKDRLTEREIFLSVLQNSASKRDAKSYISRFTLQKKLIPKAPVPTERPTPQPKYEDLRLDRTGVNLGGLYSPTKAIEESPVFIQEPLPEEDPILEDAGPLHVALVKIRQPQSLDEDTLDGIGLTISQLIRLGLNIVVAVDCDGDAALEQPEPMEPKWHQLVSREADRVSAAISKHSRLGAMPIVGALGYSKLENQIASKTRVRGGVEVKQSGLLFPLLDAGVVPVMLPIAYSDDSQKNVRVQPDDVMLALTRELSGLRQRTTNSSNMDSQEDKAIVDRIIVLDPLGGIPSEERPDKAHVFINLEQEYSDIRAELLETLENAGVSSPPTSIDTATISSTLGASNPISKFSETEVIPLRSTAQASIALNLSSSTPSSQHLKNLDLIRRSLILLPPDSSALITTPTSAAISSQTPSVTSPGVRTRRQKNPLIHNLLTDKPMVSSSLPFFRFRAPTLPAPNPATFFKKGVNLTIVPDPRTHPWKPPGLGGSNLTLRDPRIDFPRLLHLIEDSFGRKLDVEHYLSRIQNRLAGIIIAGEYDGGAILTWEYPTPEAAASGDPTRAVPYLDKFAVLRRAQGTGGVADIVFRAMVRTCFPDGVVWRSRTDNPVNKWYFERASGMWKLPGGKWTMFWTTDEMVGPGNPGKFDDYMAVCAGVQPSWSDGKPAE